MKRLKNYTRSINVKLTENELLALKTIRAESNVSVSKLIRDSIHFYQVWYNKEAKP